MGKEYKRKFHVPGDTVKTCWDFRKKCLEKHSRSPPCQAGAHWTTWTRDETKCPYPLNKPTMYIVSETLDGEWQCSCPVWKFRRQQCHHIEKARRNPEKYEIAKEWTGKLTDTMSKVFEHLGEN